MTAYAEASKAVFAVFERDDAAGRGHLDRRGVPRRRRAATRVGHARRHRGARCAGRCASEVGLAITVGVARTKFLAKVASGVAKPDGLLVVPPDGELTFLHPLPVERLWGVGPVTAAKLHAAGHRARRRRRRAPRGRRWSSMLGGPPAATCTPWPTTATRGRCRSVAAAARSARSGRSAEVRTARPSSTPCSSSSSTASPAGSGAASRVGRTVDPAAALRRLQPGHPVAHVRPGHQPHADRPGRRRASCSRRREPLIERRGITLLGIAVANLDDDGAVQLALPFERAVPGRARRGARRRARAVRLGGRHPGGAARPRPRACPCRCCPTEPGRRPSAAGDGGDDRELLARLEGGGQAVEVADVVGVDEDVDVDPRRAAARRGRGAPGRVLDGQGVEHVTDRHRVRRPRGLTPTSPRRGAGHQLAQGGRNRAR